MIAAILELLQSNKGAATVITALTVVALLGGTGAITLPADKAVDELSKKHDAHIAQAYQQDIASELRQIRWQIEGARRDLDAARRYDADESEIEDIEDTIHWLRERERQILDELSAHG